MAEVDTLNIFVAVACFQNPNHAVRAQEAVFEGNLPDWLRWIAAECVSHKNTSLYGEALVTTEV